MSGYDNHASDSDEDDFNPAPMVDEDDVEEVATNGNAKRKPSAGHENDDDEQGLARTQEGDDEEDDEEGAGGDEDDDDDEDDEDDDDEDVVQRPHKRRKKQRRNVFLDVEAEVDDEDEEEEEGDEEGGIEEVHPDDLDEQAGADLDDRRHRELDMKRQVDAQKDAEQLAKELDEKYRRREMQRAQKAAAGAVPLTLPTVNDPSIWVVRVRPGKEREVIMAIMKRIEELMNARQPVRVYSAFERFSSVGGYIYVEADAKQDMVSMIENIPNVFMGTPQIPIEVKERPDLLRKRAREPLEEGKFVRMLKPALYKEDLAKVVEVHANGLDCTVQLVPRLDYGLGEDANAGADGNKRKRPNFGRPTERPPPKLFNENEAKKRHMKFLNMAGSGGQKTFTYKGDDYQNGFLIKDVKITHVRAVDVNPRMEEMQFFSVTGADGTETLDLVAVQAAQKAAQTGSIFAAGDNVEIYDGEQKGVRGTTVSVRGDIVTLKVTEGPLNGRRIEAPVKTLRKLFRDGDHVKVIGGSKYIDEVGLVTKIKDDKVTLLCDSTQQEITVFSRDLKRAADSATLGNDSDFELNDLCQIDAATVGVVVKVDREVLRIIDQNANVRTLIHSQVATVIARNRNAVATDRDGSEIRNDDLVKEHGGEGRSGYVLHIHRGILFVQNRTETENNGVFVVRSTNVTTLAAKSGRTQATGPDLGKLNPAIQQGGPNGTAMPPPRSMGRDRLIGKTITIRKGPYKGLLGIVKDTMGDEARVELHTKNKIISVKRDICGVKDPVTGNTMDFGGKFPNRSRGGFAGATPAYNGGGRTPAWGGSGRSGPSWGTPSGGRTPGGPSWGGGRTPGWGGGDGSRTAYGGGDGSRTAYGGDGSRTAYGGDGSRTAYGGATAYGGNDGSRTAYGGSGGRTPGWGSAPSKSSAALSAPTPGAYNAPTPGGYSAPTPGAYQYSAPTPGPVDAPTPGNYSAPTPGDTAAHPTPRGYGAYGGGYGATPAAAPTPGAWAAETPYAGGPETPAPGAYDEDPRYD
ncbi:hypothetical protein BCR34DRAFT_595165 [Clohesyomyces aquaticus]|uniref:Transcription elongation factor SPT5 n=1 Tax=Clohesyomyces aquaticus TaxID=1231657 RepID=A0A1Y2AB23_9PLEO|nr:hypothetical protein BCR34DRAFT_595165 [Clohesyomyces aquaticus]